MIMYRTSGYVDTIEEFPVIKVTAHSVMFERKDWQGRLQHCREALKSDHHAWHESADAAMQYLLARAEASVVAAQQNLSRAQARLAQLQAAHKHARRSGHDH